MRAALAGSALPPHFSVVIVPPGQPRTKPRALNLALLEARGELVHDLSMPRTCPIRSSCGWLPRAFFAGTG